MWKSAKNYYTLHGNEVINGHAPSYQKHTPMTPERRKLLGGLVRVAIVGGLSGFMVWLVLSTACKANHTALLPTSGNFIRHLQALKSEKLERNFGHIYAPYLEPLERKEVRMMEIKRTGDPELWKRFFKKGHVYIIEKKDSTAAKTKPEDPRVTTFVGDQGNKQFLEDVQKTVAKDGGSVDFIIDDGGHTVAQQIASFTYLFPLVKSGGYYFIESTESSYYGDADCGGWGCYGSCCGGGAPGTKNTTVDMLKSFIDVLHSEYINGHSSKKNSKGSARFSINPADAKVDSVHCWKNICAIGKKGGSGSSKGHSTSH